jgi:hypothetical protein
MRRSNAVANMQLISMSSRGTVILDENLESIKPFLEKKNIRVRLPPKGLSYEKIAEDYLPNRIFITNNSKHFVDMASDYDIGIIAIEDMNVVKYPQCIANIISKAIKEYSLWNIRHGYILVLRSEDRHQIIPLID